MKRTTTIPNLIFHKCKRFGVKFRTREKRAAANALTIKKTQLLTLIMLGVGGKLSHATQDLVKSDTALIKQITLFYTTLDKYLKFQFKIRKIKQ